MKYLIFLCACAVQLAACSPNTGHIVSSKFIDSFLTHYSVPDMVTQNGEELKFWTNKINPSRPGMLSEGRVAGCLMSRFRLLGDISDLQKADSTLRKVDSVYNHREPSACLSLMACSITMHRFNVADSILKAAIQLGLRPYEALNASFDVGFELYRYAEANRVLNLLQSPNDYGYFFRRSKMQHFDGNIDSAAVSMLKAASLSYGNDYLKDVALAGAADLYLHNGNLQKANDLYADCIRLNSADFHSLSGLGWIALVHDHDTTLSKKIFDFILSKNKLPDPLLRLCSVEETTGNLPAQKKYTEEFVQRASDAVYGNMYNKYLITLYTGTFPEPAKAEAIARVELNNRSTPQTFAWYAWALALNNKKEQAYQIFKTHVSGRPLEPLELYWMGRMMALLDKQYDANAFFEAAYKNKYDLSPAIVEDLEKRLE